MKAISEDNVLEYKERDDFKLPPELGTEILRVEVGSTLHGTGLGTNLEDHDEMGIFIETPASTLGLKTVEHWEKRSAGQNQRSQPGDTDLIMYTARKWARLALNGNPSVLLLLHAPEDKVIASNGWGLDLRFHSDWFASKRSGKAFLGYMIQQRQRMTGERGTAGRVRKRDDGSIDWKYAMHMLRLGYQGVEYLSTGQISLPVPGETGEFLREVRQGHIWIEEVMRRSEALEQEVRDLLEGKSPLPDEPNVDAVNQWLIWAHQETWGWNS